MTDSAQGSDENSPSALAEHSDAKGPEYLEDSALSKQLSRLAAFHGKMLPAHRFGMMTESSSGVALKDLSLYERALELWISLFPQGQAERVQLSQVGRSDFPLLWVSSDETRVLLIRGPIIQGGFHCEGLDGDKLNHTAQELEEGFSLLLKTSDEGWSIDVDKPRSASDWFYYSLRRQRRIFLEAIIGSVAVAFLGIASAMYTMQVYDRVVPNKGYETLLVLTFGVAIAIALEFVLNLIRANMTDRASKAIDVELSSVFFGKAIDIRLDSRPPTVGTFAAQISHFESVRNFLSSSTLYLFADIPLALFFIIIIGVVAGPVAIVPLLIAPLAIVAGAWFRKPIEKATQLHLEESHQRNGVLIEAIDGIESVKAAGSGWKLQERWRRLTEKASQSQLRLRLLSSYSSNLAKTIQQVTHVGIVATGAYLVSIGDITMGALIACVIINGRAMGPIIQIPLMIVQWKNAQISLGVLDQIMAMPNDYEGESRAVIPDRCIGELRVESLSFSYGEAAPVVRNANFYVRPGERVAIIGPVGSGKSTLIKLLSGLYKPTTGSVSLDGVDMTHLDPEYVRSCVGYLPQDVRLFNGTLRDNLTLGLQTPSDSVILKAAELTGLSAAIKGNPRGLELQISEGGRGLSGGQRQLVGLTRLLLAQPPIVILDEPSAAIDDALEVRVMSHLFEELPQKSSVLIVTHKMSLLRHVSRVLMMSEGRIIFDGPREEVLARIKATPKAEVKKMRES